MGYKTISLSEEAYERLKAHRRGSGDSFTRVVLRAHWDEDGITAGELLDLWSDAPPFFSDEEMESIRQLKASDTPPSDKWNTT